MNIPNQDDNEEKDLTPEPEIDISNKGIQSKLSGFQPREESSDDSSDDSSGDEPDGKPDLRQEQAGQEKKGKKKGFTQEVIEKSKAAEAKVKELETQLEGYTTKEAEFTSKLETLQKELDSARTQKQESRIAEQIKQLEIERDEVKESYEAKLKQRDDQISFYDITKSEKFVSKYIKPTVEAFKTIEEYFPKSNEMARALTKIAHQNVAVLSSEDPEDRNNAEQALDEMITDLIEGLPTFKQARATVYFTEFLNKSKDQANAIKNWQQERESLGREAMEESRTAAHKMEKFWKGLYDDSEKEVGSLVSTEMDDDFAEIIKENKIEINDDEDAAIARAVLSPSAKVRESDVTRILSQGRHFKPLKAKLNAALVKIREQEKIIAKYRDSDPSSSGGSSGSSRRETGNPLQDKLSSFKMGR